MFNILSTAFLLPHLPFLIAVGEWKAYIKSLEQRKTDVKFWSFGKFADIHKTALTIERSKLVGNDDFLLTLTLAQYSNYIMSSDDLTRSHFGSFCKVTKRAKEHIMQRPKILFEGDNSSPGILVSVPNSVALSKESLEVNNDLLLIVGQNEKNIA